MRIHIDDLEIFCIIGLLDFEREKEQRVLLAIEIEYTYTDSYFIDYSTIIYEIESHLKKSKYKLLEEALWGIKTLLFEKYTTIETLLIKITKPDILPSCNVGISKYWVNISQ